MSGIVRLQQSGLASGALQVRTQKQSKPGFGFFLDSDVAKHTLSYSVFQVSAHTSNDQKRAWWALFMVVTEENDYSAGGFNYGAFSCFVAKSRNAEGDSFHVKANMGGAPHDLEVDLTWEDMAWTDIGTFDNGLTEPPESTTHSHLLCTIGHADAGTLEADTPFWMVPPPNSAFPGIASGQSRDFYPQRTWLPGDPSPVNWTGGFTLATSVNPTLPSGEPSVLSNITGNPFLNFINFEHSAGYVNPGVDSSVAGPGSTSPMETVEAEFIDLPDTIAAGVAFDFQVQLTSPFDGGADAEDVPLSYVGVTGFDVSTGPTNTPVVTELGAGLYQITGFKIFKVGNWRVKCASGAGFPLRSDHLIDVTPGTPYGIKILREPGVFHVGTNSTAFVTGELLIGDSTQVFFPPTFGIANGKYRIQGIGEIVGPKVADKDGNVFAQVGRYEPLMMMVVDEFNNWCSQDGSRSIIVSLQDFSSAIIPPSLTGTLTKTASGGLFYFDDLRAHGLGRFNLLFTSSGLNPVASGVFRLQPLLDALASPVAPTLTNPYPGALIHVALRDLNGVLLPVNTESIRLTAGPSGSDSFPLLNTNVAIVAGEATFVGSFPTTGTHGTFDFRVQSLGTLFPSVIYTTNKITV